MIKVILVIPKSLPNILQIHDARSSALGEVKDYLLQ